MHTKTDKKGILTTYTYDSHGRVLTEIIGNSSIIYTYDNNGNVLTMTDSTGTTTNAYDVFNRLTSKVVPALGTTQYAYDIITNVDSGCTAQTITDPKNNIVRKEFDKAGRLFKIIADGRTTVYNYNDDGSKNSVVYSDGSREDYTYYTDGQLNTLVNKKANGAEISRYSYTYDAAHNILSKTDSKGITSFAYDALNRIATITEPNGKAIAYTYDAAGNRETESTTINSVTTVKTYTYNDQNRLLSETT